MLQNDWVIGDWTVRLEPKDDGWMATIGDGKSPAICWDFKTRSKAKRFAVETVGRLLRHRGRAMKSAANKLAHRVEFIKRSLRVNHYHFEVEPFASMIADRDGTWMVKIDGVESFGSDPSCKGKSAALTALQRAHDGVSAMIEANSALLVTLAEMRSAI